MPGSQPRAAGSAHEQGGVARALHTVWPQAKPPGRADSHSQTEQSQRAAPWAQHGHRRHQRELVNTARLLVGFILYGIQTQHYTHTWCSSI